MQKGAVVGRCPYTGLELVYSGRGRPPKYHPDAKPLVARARREARKAKLAGA